MSIEEVQFGGMDCLKAGPDSETAIVLFHGFGATYRDLVPLQQFPRFPEATWYFPNGRIELQIGPGVVGRAWFPIDSAALEASLGQGKFLDWSGEAPEELIRSSESAQAGIAELQAKHKKIFVGGFSQGAMVACDAVLHHDGDLGGLILLSASLIAKDRWKDRLPAHQKLRVFQSHGKEDPLLAYPTAENLRNLLTEAGISVDFHAFQGGHELPPEVLLKLVDFLNGSGKS